MSDTSDTPNLDAYVEIARSEGGETLAAFLSWLVDHEDFAVCRWDDDSERYIAMGEHRMEEIMGEFFELDLDAVHAEREEVYKALTRG